MLEQKLLIGFFVCVSLLFYSHVVQTKIDIYNEQIRIEQNDREYRANKSPDEISFGIYIHEKIYLTTDFFWLNFLLIPFNFFLLWKKRFSLLIILTIINILTTASLIYWNIDNYYSNLVNETRYFGRLGNGYFAVLSNSTGLILAIASTIFVILQLAIIARFVFEKNQAKISFR